MKQEKPVSKERFEHILYSILNIQSFTEGYSLDKVKSFRNFIMHEYHAVDARVVWDTIILVLPGFIDIVEQILENEFE